MQPDVEFPGASEWFERGFVTYTNQAKHEMLDVPQSILDRFSAVSTQTVSQMLEGAIRHSNATMAVAVSGIAGPDGAMRADPSVLCLSAGSAKMKWPKSAAMNSRATVRSVREQTVAPLPHPRVNRNARRKAVIMSIWFDILCLILLILLNGFFAMSEISIGYSSPQQAANAGRSRRERCRACFVFV